MPPDLPKTDPSFHLDLENQCLRRGREQIALTPKAFAMLRHLVEHHGQLVTKQGLLNAVWPNVNVEEGQVKQFVAELRRVLGDDVAQPRFIETVHGRGYRCIGNIRVRGTARPVLNPASAWPPSSTGAPLIGREAELERLHASLARVRAGEGQFLCVCGEAGIGKTSLVSRFFRDLSDQDDLLVLRGQCAEQFRNGEPFLPVLSALETLCDTPNGDRIIEHLRHCAPLWLLQMPGRLKASDLDELQRQTQGTNQQRVLREFGRLLDTLANESVLALWLEDLHWADDGTVSLISYLAHRLPAMGVMLIGTCRPMELCANPHPYRTLLTQLGTQGRCAELSLARLAEHRVSDYLAGRWPQVSADFVRLVYRYSGGNPLFLLRIIDHLESAGRVPADAATDLTVYPAPKASDFGIPEDLRTLVEQQIERLPIEDQDLLEVASVVGPGCSAATLAAVLQQDIELVEQRCEQLVRRKQFLQRGGVAQWPDGTVTVEYEFLHVLYQQIFYERTSPARRSRQHLLAAEQLEQAYRPDHQDIAGQLALHCEQGRDLARTVRYLGLAGETALKRHGYREVAHLLSKALSILETLPNTPERGQQELQLRMLLGPALSCIKGIGDPEVENNYEQARLLSQGHGDSTNTLLVRCLLALYYFFQGDIAVATQIAEEILADCERAHDAPALVAAHSLLAFIYFYRGEFALSETHAEQGLAHYDVRAARAHVLVIARDPGTMCRIHLALSCWVRGHRDTALRHMETAQAMAEAVSHPYSVGLAKYHAALLCLFRREVSLTRESAEDAWAYANDHGFPLLEAASAILRGWAWAHERQTEEGIAEMQRGLKVFKDIGFKAFVPFYLTLLADAHACAGEVQEGLHAIAESRALLEQTGEKLMAAELHRLEGELLFKRKDCDGSQTAEVLLRKSLAIARSQEAKSWELRAATSLARLWHTQGKVQDGRDMLAACLESFTEGLGTRDLLQARGLLGELG